MSKREIQWAMAVIEEQRTTGCTRAEAIERIGMVQQLIASYEASKSKAGH